MSSASVRLPSPIHLCLKPVIPMTGTRKPTKNAIQPLNLALQGGGSHGAFTWGVLDALLEDGKLRFTGVSGTSAGAMNAAVLAAGFADAHELDIADEAEAFSVGCEIARKKLRDFWESVGTLGSFLAANPANYAMQWMPWFKPMLAPSQLNPLDINPLRSILKRSVSFEKLQEYGNSPLVPKLFICATNVRTGRGEIFCDQRVSLDAVMASACLPQLFHPVEIDGEAYWDGGFAGNPAIYPLIYRTNVDDVLLVQINPIATSSIPATLPEIQERINEVTFNASLLAELRAIEFVQRLLDEGRLEVGKYKYMHMHRIDGGAILSSYGSDSKMRTDYGFLHKLFEHGRESAQSWLAENRPHIGVQSTLK